MDILTNSTEVSVTVITLSGRLDALEAGPLRETLQGQLDAGLSNLAVDLSDVDFVDSAGLAALVKGMKGARSLDGDLRLVKPVSADAMRIFELTKFTDVFVMVDSLDDLTQRW